MARCPRGAIGKRPDGIVFNDRDLCIGCTTCLDACPYDALSLDKEAMKMRKCDMCRELQRTSDAPHCVAACFMQALEFGELNSLKIKHPEAVQQVTPLADPAQTNPSLLITPHRKYKAGGKGIIINMPEELQMYEK
jgi:anaerobic dimethyl sulfoxide reductase subunit B (iron-sulfur subunit)